MKATQGKPCACVQACRPCHPRLLRLFTSGGKLKANFKRKYGQQANLIPRARTLFDQRSRNTKEQSENAFRFPDRFSLTSRSAEMQRGTCVYSFMKERLSIKCRKIKTKMTSLDNHEHKGCDTDNPLSQSKLEAKQSAGKRARARL